MNVLGFRISRKALVLALLAFLAVSLYRRQGGRVFPNMTLRQRTEP